MDELAVLSQAAKLKLELEAAYRDAGDERDRSLRPCVTQ